MRPAVAISPPRADAAAADPRPCPGCGGDALLLYAGHGDGAAIPSPYQIARMSYGTPHPVHRCRACGLGFASIPFAPASVLEVYGEAEEPVYIEEEAARRATFRRALAPLAASKPGGRLLDVGASAGLLLVEARALGLDVVGLEPSRWAAAEATRRYGVVVSVGSLERAPFPAASFDIVTLVDVIEHFVDPFAALECARNLLRPDGILYVVTPDLGSLTARLLGKRWWSLEPWHLWYFSRPSMRQALARAGFAVTAATSYPRAFSLRYWLSKAEGMARPVARPLQRLAAWSGVAGRHVRINLHDTMAVVARPRPDGGGIVRP